MSESTGKRTSSAYVTGTIDRRRKVASGVCDESRDSTTYDEGTPGTDPG